jgi:hypothetical protein
MTSVKDSHFLTAFRRLAIAQGLTLGGLQSGRHEDFLVVTTAAALALAAGRAYTEAEVNAVLKDWLAGPGWMLATDHVDLRRWLVDCRLLERDGYGLRYMRSEAAEAWQATFAALDGVDLVHEARTARAADAARRAEQKARWECRGHTAGGRK